MKSLALVLIGTLLCTLGSGARAQSQDQSRPQPSPERRFYAGVDLGQAELNRDYPQFYFGPRRERESLAWKIRFGYQFSPRFALEAAYTDFGEYDGSGMVILLPGAATAPPVALAPGDYTTSAKGMELSAVGTWPLGEVFYVTASGGIQRREFKSVFDPSLPYQPGFRARDGDLAVQLGAGFGFVLTDSLDVGVNWVSTRNLEGDTEYLENASDPTMITAGLRVKF